MPLPNVWQIFNLRSTPFFQETLSDTYPLDLFVGRDAETDRILQGIGSAPTSRQLIEGPAGFGKTTLAQYIKYLADEDGYLSYARPVSVGSAETADSLSIGILSYVYETILSRGDLNLLEIESMQTARQLVRAFRTRDVSASISILGFGGGGGGATQYVDSGYLSPRRVVETLLPDMVRIARNELGSSGLIVHIDNLENLADSSQAQAGEAIRDIRDLFLIEGVHYLIVGTQEAIRSTVAAHSQLRSVFPMHGPLGPLSRDEFLQLLNRRYDFLRLDPELDVRPPVAPDAIHEIYSLFRGDLRGVLRAFDEAAHELLGYGADAEAAMTVADIRTVLGPRYLAEMQSNLSQAEASSLLQLSTLEGERFTQADLQRHWDVSRGRVSQILVPLQDFGYVRELERQGRRIVYTLTGPSTIIINYTQALSNG